MPENGEGVPFSEGSRLINEIHTYLREVGRFLGERGEERNRTVVRYLDDIRSVMDEMRNIMGEVRQDIRNDEKAEQARARFQEYKEAAEARMKFVREHERREY